MPRNIALSEVRAEVERALQPMRTDVSSLKSDVLRQNNDLAEVKTEFKRLNERLAGGPPLWIRKYTSVAVFFGLVAIILAMVQMLWTDRSEMNTRTKERTEFETHTKDRLEHLEDDMNNIKTSLAALTPQLKTSQEAAKQTLDRARKSGKKLSEDLVNTAGQSFVEAAAHVPSAWPVALEYAAYRSSFNSVPTSGVFPFEPEKGTHYRFQAPDGGTAPILHYPVGISAPISEAARIQPIGTQLNSGNTVGNPFIVAEGGALLLDGMELRHAVLQNVEVHYSGKDLNLTDVTFVNCTFVMDNLPRSRGLAKELLAESSVSFKSANG